MNNIALSTPALPPNARDGAAPGTVVIRTLEQPNMWLEASDGGEPSFAQSAYLLENYNEYPTMVANNRMDKPLTLFCCDSSPHW